MHGRKQFAPHLLLLLVAVNGNVGLLISVRLGYTGKTVQQKAWSQFRHDGMLTINGFSYAANDAQLSVPAQDARSLCAYWPVPRSVVAFTQRGKGLTAFVAVHREDGGEVLKSKDAELSD